MIIYYLRARFLSLLIHIHFLQKLVLSILYVFSGNNRVFVILRYLERSLGFSKVLKKGDIAIQSGVCMDTKNSQVFDIARAVGKNGTVIAIEPDPKNIIRFKNIINQSNYKCKFIIVQKAIYSQKKKTKMYLGRKASWNRIGSKPKAKFWKTNGVIFEGKETIVQMDTIDNIVRDNRINPKKISYINLTINGAEYESLKGTKEILKKSKNIAITAASGRENEGDGRNDIGYINGKPDRVVITHFLERFGFRVRFKRFRQNQFGYVIAAKGNQKFFM